MRHKQWFAGLVCVMVYWCTSQIACLGFVVSIRCMYCQSSITKDASYCGTCLIHRAPHLNSHAELEGTKKQVERVSVHGIGLELRLHNTLVHLT